MDKFSFANSKHFSTKKSMKKVQISKSRVAFPTILSSFDDRVNNMFQRCDSHLELQFLAKFERRDLFLKVA